MSDPAAAAFFQRFPVQPASAATLDASLAAAGSDALTVLFLWGNDCPKSPSARSPPTPIASPGTTSPGSNACVYGDGDMATRFSLHGIPTFFVFRGTTRLGRITSWPGSTAFADAIEAQRKKVAAPASR
ncbi:MAG: thiol reductase thioredoxin [Rhodospirillales bacterium]|nr:thiol reductase thioredoxin [Rhodospirillales bacterium]